MINKFLKPTSKVLLPAIIYGTCLVVALPDIADAITVQSSKKGPRRKIAGTEFNIGQDIARIEGGLQGMVIDNDGKWSFPRDDREDLNNQFTKFNGWLPRLEYPILSGTEFLFTAGIWVGGFVNGQKIVSTTVDGDDGTAEFGRIATWFETSKAQFPKGNDEDGDWSLKPENDWDNNGEASADFDGVPGLDDDGDGKIDEEIWNGKDDDGDGLIDEDVGCDATLGIVTKDMMLEVDDLDGNRVKDLKDLILAYPQCANRVDGEQLGNITGLKTFHIDVITGNEVHHFPGDANGDLVLDYDPEPFIDEDPPGDKGSNLIDDDYDGLYDFDDSDRDGDSLACERNELFDYYTALARYSRNDPLQPTEPDLLLCFDDDGDGLIDEDHSARATKEFFIGYVDTIQSEIRNQDSDGYTPMGILVTQKIQTFEESFADDFMIMDFEFRNVGEATIKSTYVCMFFDYDVCHISQEGTACSENDITYYLPEEYIAIGGNNGTDGGLLSSELFGGKVLFPDPKKTKDLNITYRNFTRLGGGDPENNSEKYDMMSSPLNSPDKKTDQSDWRFLIAFGPIGDMVPGQVQKVSIALVNGINEDEIVVNARQSKQQFDSDLKGPSTPIAPSFAVKPTSANEVEITWDSNSETQTFDKWVQDEASFYNPGKNRRADFEGYKIWRTENGGLTYTLLQQFDIPNNGVNLDLGLPRGEFLTVGLDDDGNSIADDFGFSYKFLDKGLALGKSYQYVVTAFDNGDNGDGIGGADDIIGVLETSRGNLKSVRVAEPLGNVIEEFSGDVYVAPNPYIGSNNREANQGTGTFSGVAPRWLSFNNVPSEAKITIFTLAGEKIITLKNEGSDSLVRWDLRKGGSGTPEVAAGIYIFKVETKNGSTQINKFVIVK